MADYVGGDPPNAYPISITLGYDKKFSLRRRDVNGDPVDWDATVMLDIDIDKTAPTRIQADVVADLATFRIESATADTIKDKTRWRAGISQTDTPTLETVVVVGWFERSDGGKPR